MYSKTPDIIPFTSPFRAELLTQAQLETLQRGTLRLLDEVGVHFPSQRALEIFADHGAQVDWETETVRIPPDLVQKAMSTAPRSFVLGGREERFDLLLDGNRSYLCSDGTGDVARMARVCDALPLIGFYWPMVSAQDYGRTAPLHQCHAGLTNTLKHVRGGMTVPPQLAPYVVEMATTVAGSAETLRQRPPICANICTIAPLAQDDHGIETALAYAKVGIPVSFMAMQLYGHADDGVYSARYPVGRIGRRRCRGNKRDGAASVGLSRRTGAPLYPGVADGSAHWRLRQLGTGVLVNDGGAVGSRLERTQPGRGQGERRCPRYRLAIGQGWWVWIGPDPTVRQRDHGPAGLVRKRDDPIPRADDPRL